MNFEEMRPGAFDGVMRAVGAMEATFVTMASTAYPSAEYSVLLAQTEVQRAVRDQAADHYHAICREIRLREAEAAELAAEAAELRA